MTLRKILTFGLMMALLSGGANAATGMMQRGKKSKKQKTETAPPSSRYKVLTGRDSVQMKGVMNVVEKGDTIFLELPVNLMGKPFLVSNKLQKVPSELNESAANKGVNYENQMVRFEWDKKAEQARLQQLAEAEKARKEAEAREAERQERRLEAERRQQQRHGRHRIFNPVVVVR